MLADGDDVLRFRALVLIVAFLEGACIAGDEEILRGGMTNGALAPDMPAVVALYGTLDMTTEDGRTVPVIVGPASGVLLCPGVVLTAMHVARNLAQDGPLAVSNLPVVWTPDEVVVRHRLWPDEHLAVRVAVPPDAHTMPSGARAVVAARTTGEDDGFLFLPLDVPYPADLLYPSFATATAWVRGDRAWLLGYGRTSELADDQGTRRAGVATFKEYERVRDGRPSLLRFVGYEDGESVLENGDSGGPLFGPVRDAATGAPRLAGIHLQSNAWSSFADLDVGAHAATLTAIRDEMCGD